MSRLLKFKEWLTIPEAIQYLNLTLQNETVTDSDIFDLCIKRHLQISMYLPTKNYALQLSHTPLTYDEITKDLLNSLKSRIPPTKHPDSLEFYYIGRRQRENEDFGKNQKIIQIEGIWDLLMVGAEYEEMMNLHYRSITGENLTTHPNYGFFLKNPTGTEIYSLQDFKGDIGFSSSAVTVPHDSPENYLPKNSPPKNSILAIRTEALHRLVALLNQHQTEPKKEASTKTINDYLRTIRALSNSLIGGLTGKHHSDAQTIAAALKGSCPISEKKLADYLKEASETPPKGK